MWNQFTWNATLICVQFFFPQGEHFSMPSTFVSLKVVRTEASAV